MDHLDKEVIESLSEPAKRVFKSLDYRSKQRMLKKASAMAKAEKMKRRKKRRFKKKGIEKWNKDKKQKKGSSSKSERVLFSFHETRELILDGFFWNGKHQSCHVCVIKIHIGKRKTI